MGRRPTPTTLKVVRGTDEPRRVRDDEPKPQNFDIKKPKGLPRRAWPNWNLYKPTHPVYRKDLKIGILYSAQIRAADIKKASDRY